MSIKEHPPQSEELQASEPIHVPVLLEITLSKLQPVEGESYLDLTAGYGGHARAFLNRTDNYLSSVLVDRDENAIVSNNHVFQRDLCVRWSFFGRCLRKVRCLF
jgi:16S rRNA (cytosine1402-N4)-methyltransferase